MGHDLVAVALRVGIGELAAEGARAGHEAGPHRRGLRVETDGLDGRRDGLDFGVRHAGDQQVLPDGQADVAVAAPPRDLGREPASGRSTAARLSSATPM